MSKALHSLEGSLTQVWQRLGRGVADARSPARTPVFATTGADGPEARIVVLRRADRALGEVEVHTDIRSGKVAALRRDPRAQLMIWDPKANLQIRLSATVELIQGDMDRWARVPEGSRLAYGMDPAPGVPIDTPALRHGQDPNCFAALVCHLTRIETVYLGADLHRRAIFDGPDWRGQWVSP